MGYLALAVALGGTSYAAVSLPAKSVGTKQLKPNAVTSPKVENRSLSAVDFRVGQLPQGDRGDPGPQGAQGIEGVQGDQGPTGAPGPTFMALRSGGSLAAAPPAGSAAIDSIGFTLPADGKLYIRAFQPDLTVNCSMGGAALYLDGVPIPFTRHAVPGSKPVEFTALVPITAGAHGVALRPDCQFGGFTGASSLGTSSLSVLLVGG